ncbi:hypothetical protein [Leifsonia xyli]|uniref:hypothetical protein n=1 Tax=Leifsonia xyli TaxID=1575 RepID=UPI003D669CCB
MPGPPNTFAEVDGPAPTKTGVLLALSLSKLDQHNTISDHNRPVTWGDLAGNHQTLSGLLQSGTPAVIRASVPNARLSAQDGFFVAGSTPKPGFSRLLDPFRSFHVEWERTDPRMLKDNLLNARRGPGKPPYIPFVAILVPARLKKRLLASLDATYNRSAHVLFPDFAGFAALGDVKTFHALDMHGDPDEHMRSEGDSAG